MVNEELKKVMVLTEKSVKLTNAGRRLQALKDEVRNTQSRIEEVKYALGEIGELNEEDNTGFNEIDRLMDQVRIKLIEQEKKANRRALKMEYELEKILGAEE